MRQISIFAFVPLGRVNHAIKTLIENKGWRYLFSAERTIGLCKTFMFVAFGESKPNFDLCLSGLAFLGWSSCARLHAEKSCKDTKMATPHMIRHVTNM